ncbi:MAG: ABC transporter substrate-binding protein, partial [Candidatus Bathyarchaeia archaeon]
KPTPTPTPTGPTPTPPAKRVLRVGFAWPCYIDPAIGSDENSATSISNLYDPLVWPIPGKEPKPWVAESWTVSADGLVYTFKIRSGIKFHSGRELTAEDVVFSMERLLRIGQGFAYLFSPYIDKVELLPDNQVRVTLKKTFGPFIMVCVRWYVVDKEEVLAHIKTPGQYGAFGDYATEWLALHDAGSGAYKVLDAKMEEWFRYGLFEDYWNKKEIKPYAPTEVTHLWTSGSPATERTMMLNRELDVTDAWLPEETLNALDADPLIRKVAWTETSEYYYMLNCKKPPLDDVHVRKALAYCLDYEKMMTEIYSRYRIATSCVPKGIAGYINCQIYKYDLTKAQEELKLSKYYPDIVQNPDKYAIEFHWIAEVPERERDALMFAECADKIGLKVNIVKTPWLKTVEEMTNFDTSAHIYNILVAAHFPEAGSLLESRYHSKNAKSWEQNEWLMDENLDSMIEDALATVNAEERYAKYAEIQRYIMDICPSLFIYDYSTTIAIQDWVKIPAVEDPSTVLSILGYDRIYMYWEVLPH